MRRAHIVTLASTILLVAIGCGKSTGKTDPADPTPTPVVSPTPTPPTSPTPAPAEPVILWTGITVSFSGTNNPLSSFVCGGGTVPPAWTGTVTADLQGGGTLVVADGAAGGIAWAECYVSEDQCAGPGDTPTSCNIVFFGETTTPLGNRQENIFVLGINDPATNWVDGATLNLADPSDPPTAPFGYGYAAINPTETGAESEAVTGITSTAAAESIVLTSAGLTDGDPVAITGPATLTLQSAEESVAADWTVNPELEAFLAGALDQLEK